jgi:hypothetical protein
MSRAEAVFEGLVFAPQFALAHLAHWSNPGSDCHVYGLGTACASRVCFGAMANGRWRRLAGLISTEYGLKSVVHAARESESYGLDHLGSHSTSSRASCRLCRVAGRSCQD